MTKSKKAKELIMNKGVVVDNCLLVESFANKCLMEEFFTYLQEEIGATMVGADPIYIEFVNGLGREQRIHKEEEKRFFIGTEWLNKTIKKSIEIDGEKLKWARRLATLNCIAAASKDYKDYFKEPPKPSFADYILGVLTFHEDIILATNNHKDFPLFLYDRLYLKTFDLYDQIYSVGFYKINEEKVDSLSDFALKVAKKIKQNNKN